MVKKNLVHLQIQFQRNLTFLVKVVYKNLLQKRFLEALQISLKCKMKTSEYKPQVTLLINQQYRIANGSEQYFKLNQMLN